MNKFAPIFIIVAASLWGFDGVVLRPSLYNLPVSLVVFIESLIVVALLSPILFKKFDVIKNLNRNDWIAFLGVGVFGGALGTMAITQALFFVNYVNLSAVILIQKLQPVFALAFAAILLKEKLENNFFIWSGLAILGTYLMTFGVTLPNFNTGEKTIIAASLSLIAAISFASSTVLSKRALKNVSFEVGTYLRFLIAAIAMSIIVLFSSSYESAVTISSAQWLIFLLIAFTTGGAAIFLYYFGLKRISASVATICELAFPLTALILEYLLRDNYLDIYQWVGVLILIVSILKVSGNTLFANKNKKLI
ncbi:MAG: DMT family transporter [Melioribacteraceae bacterium]|nr:DMT family transporter [Melioribacteraceae bacterium]